MAKPVRMRSPSRWAKYVLTTTQRSVRKRFSRRGKTFDGAALQEEIMTKIMISTVFKNLRLASVVNARDYQALWKYLSRFEKFTAKASWAINQFDTKYPDMEKAMLRANKAGQRMIMREYLVVGNYLHEMEIAKESINRIASKYSEKNG